MRTWEVGRLLLVSQAEFLLLSRNRSLSGDSLQVHSGKLEQSTVAPTCSIFWKNPVHTCGETTVSKGLAGKESLQALPRGCEGLARASRHKP